MTNREKLAAIAKVMREGVAVMTRVLLDLDEKCNVLESVCEHATEEDCQMFVDVECIESQTMVEMLADLESDEKALN